MSLADHQRRRVFSYLRQPPFWVTVLAFVALTIVEWVFLSSAIFRAFVEQNQNGLLSSYFSNYAGYDVVGGVVEDFRPQIFLTLQAVAVLVALVLLILHKYEAIALGILTVLFAYLVIAFCVVLLFVVSVSHRGY